MFRLEQLDIHGFKSFYDPAKLTFPEAMPYFGSKGVVTGNPVRAEFFDVPPRIHEAGVANVLVFGGSQGARAINNAMIDAVPLLQGAATDFRFTHQTGESDFEAVRNAYAACEMESADVRPFISDIFNAFAWADLIICRAGATTCAEVSAAGKAAIMVPLPTAADDHQRKNAEALERAGAVKMIVQAELTGRALANEILGLVASPGRISDMEAAARHLARPDAASKTVDLIEDLKRNA